MALLIYLERKMGFEPTTFSLARRCSTTEPLPPNAPEAPCSLVPRPRFELGTPAFFSAVLYRLSYLGLRLMLAKAHGTVKVAHAQEAHDGLVSS